LYCAAVDPKIDAYYALRPHQFTQLVKASISPFDGSIPVGLALRLLLGVHLDAHRRLRLVFKGVLNLSIQEFSGPDVSLFEIVSTRDRGWESPRYLVSSDQGRITFGCMDFEAEVVDAQEPVG
jgi:hypothetical protein